MPPVVPATMAEVEEYYDRVRPQLRVTEVARRNAEWGFTPPMPAWVEWATPARPVWASVIALSTALLPPWARRLAEEARPAQGLAAGPQHGRRPVA